MKNDDVGVCKDLRHEFFPSFIDLPCKLFFKDPGGHFVTFLCVHIYIYNRYLAAYLSSPLKEAAYEVTNISYTL
jgi:hypothetical protein